MPPIDHLGKYQIIEQIRYGSLGRLYKAQDPFLKRVVAVKVIVEDVLTEEVRARFFAEARASAKLNHPNIITVHDLGEDQGRLFIVMEYVEGEGLDDVIRKRADLPIEARLTMMLQIARGLRYAHANGIVHADVKPGNVMVQRDGTIKLLDFGLSRIAATAQAAGSLTAMVALGGSAYRAPERAYAHGDHRSDIFSAGAVFFDLAAAAPGLAPLDVAAEPPPTAGPPSFFRPDPDIPDDLAAVLERALRRDPAERYRDMAEMESALAAVDNRLRSEAQELRRRTAPSAADPLTADTSRAATSAEEPPTVIAPSRITSPATDLTVALPGAAFRTVPAAQASPSPPTRVTPDAAERAAAAAPAATTSSGNAAARVTPPPTRPSPATPPGPTRASEHKWAAPARPAADHAPTLAAAPGQRRRLIGLLAWGAAAAVAGIAVIALLVTGVSWYLTDVGGARERAELQSAREALASAQAAATQAKAEQWSPDLVAGAALQDRRSREQAQAGHWREATASAQAAARAYGEAARQAGAAAARGAADDARTRMLADKREGSAGTAEYDKGLLHEQQGDQHYAAGRFPEAAEQFAAAGSGYAAGRRVAAVPPAAPAAPPVAPAVPPAAPAAPRPAPSDAPAAKPADTDGEIRDVVRAYARAFEAKDLALLQRIRVAMDPDEVARHRMVFAQTKSYRLNLSIDRITVHGDEADVQGRREDLIVTRGGETIRTPRDFRFSLKRVGDRWRIDRTR